MMAEQTVDPYSAALLDYQSGNTSAHVLIQREDGQRGALPASLYFRRPEEFLPFERLALDLCDGHVLDVGAGAGAHTLALQDRGLRVTAIDISPQAVSIMHVRGVRDVRCADIFAFQDVPFDTVLILGNGIGLAGQLPSVEPFLRRLRGLVAGSGQLLVHSVDVRCSSQSADLAYQEANRKAGRYFGEVQVTFRYREAVGSPFWWVHVDADTLADVGRRAGWKSEVMIRQADGNYLARLTLLDEAD
jgi:SAM-dependent methyltransferase